MQTTKCVIIAPADVMAVEYIKKYLAQFPAASYSDVDRYISQQIPWAHHVPYVQGRLMEIMASRAASC